MEDKYQLIGIFLTYLIFIVAVTILSYQLSNCN
ncbi:MAG: hypothetical protein [Siphoviridae sp. ctjeG17]|nr:MAG: hypothetical protein [Siphoviridae sp. ctjeG17]